NRTVIDAALDSGQSLRAVARQFAVSKSSVERHQKHSLIPAPATPTAAPRADTPPALPLAVQAPTPLRSLEVQRALAAYQSAMHDYQSRQQLRQGCLPQDRSTILVPLALRVEHAWQRLAALGITPETLEGWEHYGHDPHARRYCWRSMADSMRGPR